MLDSLSKYMYEIYRSSSISEAAKKLYISQPALSSALKKAEQELGAAIFNRRTIPFTLTAEGKVYIESIEKMMQLEQDMFDKIQDISNVYSGKLNIATFTNFSIYVLPKICAKFYEKYPNIEINISITNENMSELLKKNIADIIFIPHEQGAPGYKAVPLFEENLIVALRRDTKGIEGIMDFALTQEEVINRSYPEEKRLRDLSAFDGMDFIYSPPNTTIFKKRKLIFGVTHINTYINVKYFSQKLNFNLMKEGFGAFLTTDADIATALPSEECVFFALKSDVAKQKFSLAYDATESSPSYGLISEFINTTKEFFDCENPLKKI